MQKNFEGRKKITYDCAACRFCLKVTRSKIEIDDEIKAKYKILMNAKFLESPKLSQTCCRICLLDLDKCVTVKNKIFENQKFLLESVGLDTKQEPGSEVEDGRQLSNEVETVVVKTEIQDVMEEELNCDGLDFLFDSEIVENDGEEENEDHDAESTSNEVKDRKFIYIDEDGYRTPSPKPDKSDEDFDLEEEVDLINKIECQKCRHVCCSENAFKKHMQIYHPLTEFGKKRLKEKRQTAKEKLETLPCPDCGLMVTKYSLPKHQFKLHRNAANSSYYCDYCGSTFFSRRNLLGHMRRLHKKEVTVSKCRYCKKEFTNKKSMMSHVKKFHENSKQKEPPIICDMCGIQLSNKKSYAIHLRSKHTNEKPFKCLVCSKEFFSSSALRAHVLKNHSAPETCQVCNKKCKSKSHLREHMAFVHDEKKFKCPVEGCEKKYGAQKLLQSHLYKHVDVKRYVCTVCSRAYKDRNGMEQHVHAIHLNFQIHCLAPNCPATFHRKDYYRTHIKRKHADLGQAEVERIIEESKKVKLPSIRPYYKSTTTVKDHDIFKKLKKNNEIEMGDLLDNNEQEG